MIASLQVFNGPGVNQIQNISATIMRNTSQGLTGITLPANTYNLSFPGNTGDVTYPPTGATSTNIISSLRSSLWTVSGQGPSQNTNLSGTTIYMNAIDNLSINGTQAATSAYYALRVQTDDPLVFGNVNINCFKLS